MSATVVRPARPDDARAVAAIYAPYVRESTATFELEAPEAPEIERRMSAIRSQALPYLVAESGGAVVGYAYATPFRPRPAYRFTIENSVYVDALFQRRGIGGLLLRRLIEECGKCGMRQMIAAIGGSNAGSIALHTANGFVPAGVLRGVGWKFDQWLDVTLMQREL